MSKKAFSIIQKLSKWQVLFGGNYFDVTISKCWFVWDKDNGTNKFADCELIWTNLPGAVRLLRHTWDGFIREGNEQRDGHPTQKPVGVMGWCIDQLPDRNTILDPFMGAGTTGGACMDHGRKFIGIEREPKYFDIACQRIRDAQKQQSLDFEAAS